MAAGPDTSGDFLDQVPLGTAGEEKRADSEVSVAIVRGPVDDGCRCPPMLVWVPPGETAPIDYQDDCPVHGDGMRRLAKAAVNATVDRANARDLAVEKRRIEDENLILRRTVDRLTRQVQRLKERRRT
jgi:hypothetical protein